MKRSIFGVAIVLAFVAVGIAAAPPLTFTFTDVVASKTAIETDSYAVNNAGAITGDYVDSAGIQHGMILAGKKLTTFDYKKCTGGIAAYGINKAGTVAGWCTNSSGIPIGWTWTSKGFKDVNFPKGTGTEATGINDKGDVAGAYFDSAGAEHGFVKLANSTKFTPINVKGAISTVGWGITNAGVVTLEVTNSSGLFDSYTYTVSTKKLKKIDVPGATQSIVHTPNNKGDIVYTIFDSASAGHGVLFHKGTYTQFDDPKASNSTRGDGLNDTLVIVGRYTPSTGGNFGFKAVAK